MIKLKNILKEQDLSDLENKLGFDSGANRDPKTGNLSDKYQSLSQRGEIPMLDPKADTEVFESALNRLEKNYMLVKPKRVDVAEFKNDVRDLISIYKDKDPSEARKTYYKQFFELYPIAKTNSSWKGILSSITDGLNFLLRHSADVHKGDTSSYGYRVNAWQKEKGIR
jgi:hypothetical protein